MSITDSSSMEIVDFKASGVIGKRALGSHLLRFSLDYHIPGRDEYVYFRNIYADVGVGGETSLLGRAYPESPLVIKNQKHPQSLGILFDIFLNSVQLEEIEKIRCGSDIQFTLDIKGSISDEFNETKDSDKVIFRVNQKEWIEALYQMNYGNFILYEMPANFIMKDSYKSSYKSFIKAKNHLFYGNYDDVVAKCRLALDRILKESDVIKEARRQYCGDKKQMKKEARLMNAIDAINHCTQLGHHHDSDHEEVNYTRSEAVFVLGITAAALSSFGEFEMSIDLESRGHNT